MSDSFLVAARVPMSRTAFERWLDTPLPGRSAIANPDAMFDGWYWHGQSAPEDWDEAAEGRTVREWLSERVEDACTSSSATILRYRDEAVEAYLFDVGYYPAAVQAALLAFAATEPAREALVLFWAETGGSLWKPDDEGWMAALEVAPTGARFVGRGDLTPTVAGLRRVEAEFFAMIERVAEDEERWDPDSQVEFRTSVPLEYVDL
ncbi:hypothetical protein [Dactylosporangium sp. NPDC051541]|uniref:hypothetical protein n=1 Tax=Dactylosporangium sp. NPDC051541 TaxID=3363977 RepID=UPI0037B8355F